jgi:hypothetical protein
MIGEAREKFGTIAGPTGGTTLNGTAMKAEGKEKAKELEDDLKYDRSGVSGYTWIVG